MPTLLTFAMRTSMDPEINSVRNHRTWLERLRLWPRAYETKITDAHHEAIGRGPTTEASYAIARRRWHADRPDELRDHKSSHED